MVAIPLLDIGRVVEFVNEYADRPRVVAGEQETPYPDAVEVLGWPGELPVPAVGVLVGAANAAFRVFASTHDGGRYEELNALLRSTPLAPVATGSGLRWTIDAPDELVPAALSVCLLEWLMGHEQSRLGTCDASNCADVYADASPAGRRRFCSSTCLNRYKVAAYRQRSARGQGRPTAG
jgi:hypothetical protein